MTGVGRGLQGRAGRAVALLALLLTGCASTAVKRNLEQTGVFTTRELGVAAQLRSSPDSQRAAEERARVLLAEPLSGDAAVELAIGYSPAFQSMLADLAAESAATYEFARPPNPTLGYGRLSATGVMEIDRVLAASLLDILLLPQRRNLADLQQLQHRLRAAGNAVAFATAVRRAWVEAVAARQSQDYAEQARQAASAAAELGRRMATVGNFSRLEAAREQAFFAETTVELSRATLDAQRSREALIRLLGLTADLAAELRLPQRLPELPAIPDDETLLAQRAFGERLDVALARAELDFTARSLGLTRVTSTVNALDVGTASSSESGEKTLRGYELEVALPVFDFGDARRANARAIYLSALNRTATVMAEAQSHVRESYLGYRTSYEIARHYRDEIVPLHKTIADENLLLYNGMLISVFELLAEARGQIAGVREAIAAQRDFWLADATLRSTLIGMPTEGVAQSH